MRKLTDVVNNKKSDNKKSDNNITNILEELLVVESLNEDLTNHNINIIGIDEATTKLEKEFAIKLIKEQIKLCSNIYNNFRVGQFKYLDSLMESLQTSLEKIKNE